MVWLIDDIGDAVLSLGEFISQALEALINAIIHPFFYILNAVGVIIMLILNGILSLLSALWATFTIMYDFISTVFTGFMPNLWTTLILLAITIVFLLRLYYFVKDISILGNKI